MNLIELERSLRQLDTDMGTAKPSAECAKIIVYVSNPSPKDRLPRSYS